MYQCLDLFVTILFVCEDFAPRHSYVEGTVCKKTKLAIVALFIPVTRKDDCLNSMSCDSTT